MNQISLIWLIQIKMFAYEWHSSFHRSLKLPVAYFAVISIHLEQDHEANNKELSHCSIMRQGCLYSALPYLSPSFILSRFSILNSENLFHCCFCLAGYWTGIIFELLDHCFWSGFHICPLSIALSILKILVLSQPTCSFEQHR